MTNICESIEMLISGDISKVVYVKVKVWNKRETSIEEVLNRQEASSELRLVA